LDDIGDRRTVFLGPSQGIHDVSRNLVVRGVFDLARPKFPQP
jgi:hypothetical protein